MFSRIKRLHLTLFLILHCLCFPVRSTYLTCNESQRGIRSDTCTLTNINDIYSLRKPLIIPSGIKNVICLNSNPRYFPSIVFETYRQLERFTAINCTISTFVTHQSTPFVRAFQLKELNLSRNSLRQLVNGLFHGARRLQNIDLSYNKIDSIHPDTFKELRYLNHLNLSHNSLWGLNLVLNVVQPMQLIAVHNQITTLGIQGKHGKFFPSNMNLHLDVRHNRITRVNIPPYCPVKSIFLDHNHLNHVSSVARIKRLIRFSLYYNPIFSPEFIRKPYTPDLNLQKSLYVQTRDKGIMPVEAPPSNCTGEFERHYCLNKGTCFSFAIDFKIILLSCSCPDDFHGERCEEKSTSANFGRKSSGRGSGGYPLK
ncbi:uncharacterized protein LOC134831808 [Culicoides brevitarsis]|uniref:uncharacterized protein LOC134831808 n=1 Tax=Culicoides brevitarsis TaxID=469753 RepID=UPI00307B4EA4